MTQTYVNVFITMYVSLHGTVSMYLLLFLCHHMTLYQCRSTVTVGENTQVKQTQEL